MRLSYITRGNSLPNGKAKVYITAHPEDFDACLDRISDDLLRCRNCAVYYDEERIESSTPEDLSELLTGMNLFVIPITLNFLRSKNRARNIEFPFAMKNHIPVLLLIEDPELVTKADRIGQGLPVLSRYQEGGDVPYIKRLNDYLDSILLEDGLTERIHSEFSARVYLGCRKKDRRKAESLMQLIHSSPMCRDIAICHNDFLAAGESCHEADSAELRKSDLFVLAVTPNLLETDNFIMKTMYPMAVYAGKHILAAELQATDRYALEMLYPGIPRCAGREEITDSVIHALAETPRFENQNPPEHNFLIGLAYLHGIDVEVNRETALNLITDSANSGLPEAMIKLEDMYRYGIGVEQNLESASKWHEKFLTLYKENESISTKTAFETEKPKTDSVNFSVLSPRAVKADSYGVINLHMYTDVQREVVEQAIRESNGLVNETKKEGFAVSRGTSITARLESEQAEIKDPLDTQVWNGKSLHFDFQFYVPQNFSHSQIAFVCYIECNGIPITRLNFITAVSRLPDSEALPAKVTKSDYKKAFISYSRKDEQRMLERVVGIQELAPQMKFWLDKQSLDAGDVWREEIKKAIVISDLLLLFWSVPASQSKQVEMEWSYALDQKGLSFIAPVPLDPPAMCPPPAQLKALNFTVRSFYRNEMTEKLSFYDSNNIEIL